MAQTKLDKTLLQGSYESAVAKWKGAYQPVMNPVTTDLAKTPMGKEVRETPMAPPSVRFPYGIQSR